MAEYSLPFSDLMGLKIIDVTKEKVVAELPVRDDLCTRPAMLHGGAVMATSSPQSWLATRQRPNAPRCIAAAPPWCGRPASRAATASWQPS